MLVFSSIDDRTSVWQCCCPRCTDGEGDVLATLADHGNRGQMSVLTTEAPDFVPAAMVEEALERSYGAAQKAHESRCGRRMSV